VRAAALDKTAAAAKRADEFETIEPADNRQRAAGKRIGTRNANVAVVFVPLNCLKVPDTNSAACGPLSAPPESV
jgi:hypothetical protein